MVSRAGVRRRPVSNHKALGNQASQTVPGPPPFVVSRPEVRRRACPEPVEGAHLWVRPSLSGTAQLTRHHREALPSETGRRACPPPRVASSALVSRKQLVYTSAQHLHPAPRILHASTSSPSAHPPHLPPHARTLPALRPPSVPAPLAVYPRPAPKSGPNCLWPARPLRGRAGQRQFPPSPPPDPPRRYTADNAAIH